MKKRVMIVVTNLLIALLTYKIFGLTDDHKFIVSYLGGALAVAVGMIIVFQKKLVKRKEL